jgi:transcriptional regulator with XRE-family HTH domain
MALLNRRLIATRRATLGLSRHDLAQATGLATGTIEHIETNGSHGDLQLSSAVQLAGALGVALADLLQPPGPARSATSGDVAVEALLAEQRQPLTAEELADALDWTLARTLAALRALQRRLVGTGQALQHIPTHRYALVPDATAADRSPAPRRRPPPATPTRRRHRTRAAPDRLRPTSGPQLERLHRG